MATHLATDLPSTPPRPDTLSGVASGMGAGALWGLVFLAPQLVSDFGPLHMSVGRYLCYGLIAALLLGPRWCALRGRVTRQHWRRLQWLALTGNTLYYVLLSGAVQNGGIAMTALVIGFLPVAVTVIGSRDHGAVGLKRLLPSLLLCAAGTVLIAWQAFVSTTAPGSAGAWRQQAVGLACAIGALVSWTAYAVGNARSLKRLKDVSAHDWNLLTGVVTGLQAVVLMPVALVLESTDHPADRWLQFGAVSLAVALLASIVGNALWNRMSRLLPLTLVGQMILFETLCALLYGFAWERRLPTLLEAGALACVVLGVCSCLAAHRAHPGKVLPLRSWALRLAQRLDHKAQGG